MNPCFVWPFFVWLDLRESTAITNNIVIKALPLNTETIKNITTHIKIKKKLLYH